MNIWIDICHTPQYNFCANLIRLLAAKGHYVYVTVLSRGRLVNIVNNEMSGIKNVSIEAIGEHRLTKKSALWDANIKRVFQFLYWVRNKHIDMAFSANTIPCALVCRLKAIPSYVYADDATRHTYKIVTALCTNMLNTCVPKEGYFNQDKIKVLNVLKEWAYLAPKYFHQNVKILNQYGLCPKEYIFLREVSVGTFNYAGQTKGCVLAVKDLIDYIKTIDGKKMKVLFSLEEKHRRNEYPEDWILLQEPIEDIHSLIYYAAGLVSSGDSMAREAALLGIPAYYLGTRHSMPANLAAAKVANLQNELTMPFEKWLGELNEKSVEERMKAQEELRKKIDEEFIDINAYMISLVEKLKE